MAIVQHKATIQSGTAWSITFNSAVTAGNLIAFFVLESDDAVFGISAGPSDGLGNTYVNVNFDAVESILVSGYYAKNIAGGSCTISMTMVGAVAGALHAFELSGRDTTSPLDQGVFDGLAYTGSDDMAINFTTLDASEDFVGAMSTKGGASSSVDAPFSGLINTNGFASEQSASAANQAAGAATLRFNRTVVGNWTAGVMTFRASGGGGSSNIPSSESTGVRMTDTSAITAGIAGTD